MLKELFDLVKSNANDSVINNPDVPNEHNDAVVAEATNTVASGLRNVVAGGGLQSLLSLFGGGNNKSSLLSNPIVSMMIGHFASKLMNNFKMGNSQASNVAGNLIPDVLGSLVNKVNDPGNTGFSLENLLRSITGGKSDEVGQQSQGGGLGDLLKQVTSGGNGSSGGGLMDLVKSLAGGAMQQQQQNGGGGLMDLIKGFIK
ncbi:MAG: hypothetical protein ABJA57_00195 [Ginsengibacter sp.]